MSSTYYRIAENIYVQGVLDNDGVEINGESVKKYIESEMIRIESWVNHHRKDIDINTLMLIICTFGIIIGLVALASYPQYNTILFTSVISLCVLNFYIWANLSAMMKNKAVRNHENYSIRDCGDYYIITPKSCRPQVITEITSGKFTLIFFSLS